MSTLAIALQVLSLVVSSFALGAICTMVFTERRLARRDRAQYQAQFEAQHREVQRWFATPEGQAFLEQAGKNAGSL